MTSRSGFYSASGLCLVGVAYVVVVGAGVAQAGLEDPIVDPILAVMEVLTLLAAPLVVILMAAIHSYAAPPHKTRTVVALAFGVLMAGLTSGVHFVALTAGRQMGSSVLRWPSTSYAIEVLAWDLFLGLALLFAAPAFDRTRLNAITRRAMSVTGALCIMGTIGPLVGDMRWQRIGIVGYGVGLPITCLFLALVFRQPLRVE